MPTASGHADKDQDVAFGLLLSFGVPAQKMSCHVQGCGIEGFIHLRPKVWDGCFSCIVVTLASLNDARVTLFYDFFLLLLYF